MNSEPLLVSRLWSDRLLHRCKFFDCREATDRQIALDNLKRQEIEKRKDAELAAERARISDWQTSVAQGSTGLLA